MPSFCAKPQGGVAGSIIQRITPALRERGDRRRRWVRAGVEYFSPPLIRPEGHLLPEEKVLSRLGKWLKLQLQGRPIFQNETGRGKKDYNFFQLFKLLYDFELKEISAEMHGDLEGFFVHRPVSHFHRLIDVFYRVSVTE